MSDILANSTQHEPLTQDERDDLAANIVRKALENRLTSEINPVFSILWSKLTAQERAEWEAYRLLLLSVTEQPEFPKRVVWPTRPGQGTEKDWLAKFHADPDRYPHPDA
jgi:hypothetical protein